MTSAIFPGFGKVYTPDNLKDYLEVGRRYNGMVNNSGTDFDKIAEYVRSSLRFFYCYLCPCCGSKDVIIFTLGRCKGTEPSSGYSGFASYLSYWCLECGWITDIRDQEIVCISHRPVKEDDQNLSTDVDKAFVKMASDTYSTYSTYVAVGGETWAFLKLWSSKESVSPQERLAKAVAFTQNALNNALGVSDD